jgi:hypothetical protein
MRQMYVVTYADGSVERLLARAIDEAGALAQRRWPKSIEKIMVMPPPPPPACELGDREKPLGHPDCDNPR